ncbi:MAG TPA: hypothetical protein VGB55_08640 [Tepidisphaeraceae bacterium]|jgi:hypothetical protein
MSVIVPVVRCRPGQSRIGPVLVGVEYLVTKYVRLTFDREIDVSGIVPAMVRVNDADLGDLMEGSSVTMPTPQSVKIMLRGISASAGPGLTLTVGQGNGIASLEDGAAWAGVTDATIPFSVSQWSFVFGAESVVKDRRAA